MFVVNPQYARFFVDDAGHEMLINAYGRCKSSFMIIENP